MPNRDDCSFNKTCKGPQKVCDICGDFELTEAKSEVNVEAEVSKLTKHVKIGFGGLVEPLAKQLKEQELKYTEEDVEIFQECNDAIFTLHLSDILTYNEVEKARQKLYKQILAHIKKKNKLKAY